jgi:hypothetical protein
VNVPDYIAKSREELALMWLKNHKKDAYLFQKLIKPQFEAISYLVKRVVKTFARYRQHEVVLTQ